MEWNQRELIDKLTNRNKLPDDLTQKICGKAVKIRNDII